jgi:hypothetical protein
VLRGETRGQLDSELITGGAWAPGPAPDLGGAEVTARTPGPSGIAALPTSALVPASTVTHVFEEREWAIMMMRGWS